MTTVNLGIPGIPGGRSVDPEAPRPEHSGLLDQFGRVATDLRVSLTDHCNLRCTYCMPAEGLDWLPREAVLTEPELTRLLRIAVTHLGITDIRFTGGEPLLRKGLREIVAATAALSPRPRMSITSNGVSLDRRAADLAAAGLDRVNISLDSVRRETFREITRRDRLDSVLAGLEAAREAGMTPVKVNAVLLRGVNDDQAVELLRFCLDNSYALRFIEQMPLDPQHGWARSEMVTAEEILDSLRTGFDLAPSSSERGSAPAEQWQVSDGTRSGTVGVVGSVTRPFCAACDRTRLTADGQMRTCLFATTETDLRGALRSGASDTELADLWRTGMWGKLAGHQIDSAGFAQPIRPMSAIGG